MTVACHKFINSLKNLLLFVSDEVICLNDTYFSLWPW